MFTNKGISMLTGLASFLRAKITFHNCFPWLVLQNLKPARNPVKSICFLWMLYVFMDHIGFLLIVPNHSLLGMGSVIYL